MGSMFLQFVNDPSGYPGGEVYAQGKHYLLGSLEACLWLRRGLVDTKTMREADTLPDLIAESDANLRPGARLTLAQVILDLREFAS